MNDAFDAQERSQIVTEAHETGLTKLHCPRDGTLLRWERSQWREIDEREPGRGIKVNNGRVDILSIGVECPKCGTQLGAVSLSSHGY